MKLYRGTNRYIDDGIIINDYLTMPRKPKNSPLFIHEVADKWFEEKLGINGRSQTIFTSLCKGHAREYQENGGSLLEVDLSKNSNYSLIFSPHVYDFLKITEEIKNESDAQQIIRWLESKQYQRVDNVEKVPEDFKGEIMLYCKEYKVENI